MIARKSPAANRLLHDHLLRRAVEFTRDLCTKDDVNPLQLTASIILLWKLFHGVSHWIESDEVAFPSNTTANGTEQL